MKETVFVIGGCRSGKSRQALETAAQMSTANRVFIATCIPADDEMRLRVERHRQQRGGQWRTVEAPVGLAEAIVEHAPGAGVLVVDCLTLWVSNLLLEKAGEEEVAQRCRQVVDAVTGAACPVVLVSNEVGGGIVPENRLARQFRDQVGSVNQAVAACADRVIWMVAGIPVFIKG